MNTEEAKQYLEKQNEALDDTFHEVPRGAWPTMKNPPRRVYRNRQFLVQEYMEENWITRLSVCKADIAEVDGVKGPIWVDGITWEELQWIKNAVGYEHRDALEVFPKARDVVNVANFRHLWVMPENFEIDFVWRKKSSLLV